MNWVAIEGEDKNLSIHSQQLQDLSDLSISSFSKALSNSYKHILNTHSTPHQKYGIADIVRYLKSFPYFSNSSRSLLPYWISDLIYGHISHDEHCPIDFITEFFSEKICSLSSLNLSHFSSNLIVPRISHLRSFPLTTLDFSWNVNIDNSVLQLLTNSNLSDSLRTLKLRGCTQFNFVSSLYFLTNLEHLDLSENESLNWGSGATSCLWRLSKFLSSFTRLQTLDLHFTNIFPTGLSFVVLSDHGLYPPANVNLTELYLHMRPSSPDSYPSSTEVDTRRLVTYISEFPFLTHLDLSGWPFLDKTAENAVSSLSQKLTFLGLYQTPITAQGSEVVLHSLEASGLNLESYLVTTVQRYSGTMDYLKALFVRLFDNMMKKSVIYSEEISLKLIPLVLDALDRYISLLPPLAPPSTWLDLNLLISCTACLYALECSVKQQLTVGLIRRSVETAITLLYKVGLSELSIISVGQLVANTCSMYALWSNAHSFKQSHQTMHNILCKYFLGVIDKACENPGLLVITNGGLFSHILDRSLRIFYTLLFGLDVVQKGYVGIELNGVDTLMRFLDMKLTTNSLDADLHHASGALMNITYLCLPNCLRLSKREHSELLVRLLGEIPHKEELIALIMACIENIAEFCLQDESAGVSSQLLAPVMTVLRDHSKYNQDSVSCAIAFTAYFAMGHEKWDWREDGGEALALAVEAINSLDFRKSRSVSYNTLDFLAECLGAKDSRILLCALWIVCNLVYKSPDYYLELLSEEAVEVIKGISCLHPKDSIYHKLSSEVLMLLEITRKCAELK